MSEIPALIGEDVGDIFDDDLDCDICPHESEVLEAAFLGMPMGWGWALLPRLLAGWHAGGTSPHRWV